MTPPGPFYGLAFPFFIWTFFLSSLCLPCPLDDRVLHGKCCACSMVVRVSIHMVKYTGSATDQCNCVQLNCFSFLAGRRLFDWLIDFTTLGTRKRERERDMPDMGYYNGSPVLQLQSVLFSSLFTSNCGSRAQAQANKMRMTDDTNNGTVGTCSHCFKLSEVCTCVSVYVFNSQATKLVQGVINRCCRKWSNGTEGKHEK